MPFDKTGHQQSIWINEGSIICEEQNLQEQILLKQKQLVLMEQRYYILMNSNNCLKEQMTELKKQIIKLQNKLQNQIQLNHQLDQTIFDLKQKITQIQARQTDSNSNTQKDFKILQLNSTIQKYQVQIKQLENFHKVQLNNLRFSCQQSVKQLMKSIQEIKAEKKSQLNYYLNIIGEMQKQIELLRQLNQFGQKNSNIEVKQLKFQKSIDSFGKSDPDSFNMFQETIKISKIGNNSILQKNQQYSNTFTLHNNHLQLKQPKCQTKHYPTKAHDDYSTKIYDYSSKFQDYPTKFQDYSMKFNEYSTKVHDSPAMIHNYKSHILQLKQLQQNEKNRQQTSKLTILSKDKYKNKSLQNNKMGKQKSQSYLKKYYPAQLINSKYGSKNKFIGDSQIDKKLNKIKQCLSKQLYNAFQ